VPSISGSRSFTLTLTIFAFSVLTFFVLLVDVLDDSHNLDAFILAVEIYLVEAFEKCPFGNAGIAAGG
jgi:uncharacterized membrane protein YqjE